MKTAKVLLFVDGGGLGSKRAIDVSEEYRNLKKMEGDE